MKRLDELLLGAAERFAHRFQRLTGKTNFWLAKVSFAVYCVGVGGSAFLMPIREQVGGTEVVHYSLVAPVAMGLVLLLGIFRLFPFLDRVQEHYFSGSGTAHAFTLVMRQLWYVRLALIMMGFPSLLILILGLTVGGLPASHLAGVVLLVTSAWGMVAAVFFVAVVPLPPGKSKVREFLESLLPAPQTATSEAAS